MTWPVYAGVVTQRDYVDPAAPVHLLIGSAGASFQGPWHPVQPAWSAFREQTWGYSSLRFDSATLARFEFVAFNTSEVRHAFNVTRSAPPAVVLAAAAAGAPS